VADRSAWSAEGPSVPSSGALYDVGGPPSGNAPGVPPPVPGPLAPGPQANASAWWSDATADPWRDPAASSAIIVSAPTAAPVETPDFTPKHRRTPVLQVLLISLITALLAGGLGGALGFLVASRSGAGNVGLGNGNGSAPALANRAPTSLAGVIKAVMPSVVTIRAQTSLGTSIGSGFIASTDGYVITNDHVVSGLTGDPTVKFSDATTARAKLVGTDVESDIAVLKVAKTGLPAVTFGDSDTVATGDPVLAFGAPLDLENTVTYGIISALHRPLEINDGSGPTRYYAAIQTDAAVNHGNSGGPLIDGAGRVIGVNAVIKSLGASEGDAGNIGLAFAIPIDQARRTATDIITNGKVSSRTVMGVTVASPSQGGGVELASVANNGPADASGLKPGDVVLEVGGGLVDAPGDLTALVREYAPGTVVPVVFKRAGVSHTAQVKLAADAG
jgi:putative serine protease PepD